MFNKLRPNKRASALNILHLSAYNIANIPYLLSKGINDLTEHRSICATLIFPYCDYIKYPEDLMLSNNMTPNMLRELILEADIIHIHNSIHQIIDHPQLPSIKRLLTSKQNKFLHGHGTYHRVYSDLIEQLKKEMGGFQDIIATPDTALVAKFPNAKYLPNPINIENYKRFQTKDTSTLDVIKIAHSPTYRPSKSTHYLETIIIPELQKKYADKIQFEYIFNKSNEECLNLRSNCILNFDQILVGTYGLGAQESVAQGLIPIVRIGSKADEYLKKHFGFDHPFLVTTKPNQEDQFDSIISLVDVGSDKTPPSEEEITKSTLLIEGFEEQLLTTMMTLLDNYEYREQVRSNQIEWLSKTHSLPLIIESLIEYYLNNMK